MSNKITIQTAFRNSAAHPEDEKILPFISRAIKENRDPLEAWRRWKGVGFPRMAEILECDEQSYKMHARRLVRTKPAFLYSPLNGQHILNFSRFTGIHPADLTSPSSDYKKSVLPAVYEAMQMVFTKPDSFFYDRSRAGLAIKLEAERYQDFVKARPDIAADFERISAHAFQYTSRNVKKRVLSELESITNSGLKDVLTKAFEAGGAGRPVVYPQNHIEDFHTTQRLRLQENMQEGYIQEKKDMELAKNLRHMLVSQYGNFRSNEIYYDLNEAVRQTQTTKPEILLPKLEKLLRTYTLSGSKTSQEAITSISKTAYDFFIHKRNTEAPTAILKADVKRMVKLDSWFIDAQLPEFSYLHNLYCNDVTRNQGPGLFRQQLIEFKKQIV